VDADDLVEIALGLKTQRLARCAEKLRGQPSTMRITVGSGSRRMRATTPSPATRRSDAICSPTVAASPGMVRLRRQPSFWVSMVAAWIRKPTAERGEACQWRTSSETGSTASCPASGSRMMFEKNPDAALFGRPGRTQMVGRRCRRRRRTRAGCSPRAAIRRSLSGSRSWSAAS
jgi:hypothetical protein